MVSEHSNPQSVPLLEPRFIGRRFENGRLPIDVLTDISALSELIVEVAKWQYLRDNPERKRVPKKFLDNFSLSLIEIKSGSAIPVISMALMGAISLFPELDFERLRIAKTAIVNAISAAENGGKAYDHLNPKLLSYFDKFGKNLLDDEKIEISDGLTIATLNREVRKRLLLDSASHEYSELTSIYGKVHELDQDKKTFQITTYKGSKIQGILAGSFYDIVKDASFKFEDGVKIRLHGTGYYNSIGKLIRFDLISDATLLHELDVRARIDEFKLLEPGWYDGDGVKFSVENLDWLIDELEIFCGENDSALIPLPYLFPTPDGHVLAEWSIADWSISLIIDPSDKTGKWHALNLKTDSEYSKKFQLDSEQGWTDLSTLFLNTIKS